MKRRVSGFTLIELMIVVAIIGILAAVAVPAFVNYMRKAKTVEAVEALDKIKIGAREYFVVDHWSSAGTLLPSMFPQAVNQVPVSGPCCQKCFTTPVEWESGGWSVLRFGLSDPHFYAYTFAASGTGSSARYTANALGDLDCDSTYSTYQIRGSVDGEGGVIFIGPLITDELE